MAQEPTPAAPSLAQPDKVGTGGADAGRARPPAAEAGKDTKDPIQELLATLAGLQGRVAATDPVTAQAIAGVLQQGANDTRRVEPIFRHQLAFAVQDVEKVLREKVEMPAALRTEMTARANTAPGLEDGRVLALLRSTSTIDDHRLVRDIRAMAFEVGAGRSDPGSPTVRSHIDTIENAMRLATRAEAPPSSMPPPGAVRQPDGSRTAPTPPSQAIDPPQVDRAYVRQGPAAAAHGSRTPFDAIMSGLRGASTSQGAPWDPPPTPIGGRLSEFEGRMQQGRDDRLLQTVERSGRAALDALQGFKTGEAATVMNRINAAARSEPGGMAEVLAEMKQGGRFADLRQQFNNALATDRGVTASYDRAAAALAQYGKDRTAVDSVIAKRPDATNLTAKFDALDAQIGTAAASTPSRREGRGMIDDLAQKAAELLQRAVDGARAFFNRTSTAEAAARPGPSPGS